MAAADECGVVPTGLQSGSIHHVPSNMDLLRTSIAIAKSASQGQLAAAGTSCSVEDIPGDTAALNEACDAAAATYSSGQSSAPMTAP